MAEVEYFYKWSDIKAFLKGKYTVEKEDENSLVFVFGTNKDEKRSQVIHVIAAPPEKDDANGVTYIQLVSRVGEMVPKKLDGALEFVSRVKFGGLIKIGEKYYLRHSVHLDGLNPEILDDQLGFVCTFADYLERQFVGGDDN